MKNVKQLILCTFGALLLFAACNTDPLNNAIDEFSPIISIKPIQTSGIITLQDMNTNELINGAVTVTFSGPGADAMVDMYSDPVERVTVENGFMNYYVSNDVIPTTDDPLKVTLNITKDGYLPLTKTISIADTGSAGFRMRLADKNNLPKGITKQTKAQTTADATTGQTADAISLVATNTGADGSSQDSTQAQIAAGSILTDANGTPLTGQLTSTVTHYSPADPQAMSYLQSLNEEMSTPDSAATLIGLTEVEITDASGHRATGLQAGQAKAKQKVAAGPHMQSSLQCEAGQTLISSKSEYNFNAPPNFYIVSDGKGYIKSSDKIQGTTYSVCIDGVPEKYSLLTDKVQVKNIDLTINLNGNDKYTVYTIFTYGYSQDYSYISKRRHFVPWINDPEYPVTYDLTFYLPTPYETSIEVGGRNSFTIDLPEATPKTHVNVALQCKDPSKKVRVQELPYDVLYRKVGSNGDWNFATNTQAEYNRITRALESGSFDLAGVERGASYDVKVAYDNTEAGTQILMDSNNVNHTVTISSSICK